MKDHHVEWYWYGWWRSAALRSMTGMSLPTIEGTSTSSFGTEKNPRLYRCSIASSCFPKEVIDNISIPLHDLPPKTTDAPMTKPINQCLGQPLIIRGIYPVPKDYGSGATRIIRQLCTVTEPYQRVMFQERVSVFKRHAGSLRCSMFRRYRVPVGTGYMQS
jgi:hypothetical protein